MDQVKFDKLLEVANKQEQTTLKVLYNAVVKCINDLNAGSSSVTVKDWEKTRNSYEQYTNELWNKYFPPAPAEVKPEYKSIQEVIRRVNEMGYKLAKSAYNHADRGLLRPNSEGIYTQEIIDKYISQASLRKKDGSKKKKFEKINSERQSAETRRITALAQREELKYEIATGKYILKESMEREFSYRAMVFKTDGESFCRAKPGEIISLVGGDAGKIPDLTEFMLTEFHKWLSRYAADREFTVPAPAAEDILQDLDDDNSEIVDGE